ncbi:hypothetical protein Tco_0995396, partial [Tanacetum coccineum]
MALPPREQRHRFLRYEGLQYSDAYIADFEGILARIYRREVHRVSVFDFGGLPDSMAEGLSARMLMEHKDDQGVSLFTSRACWRLFDIRGPLVHELILEFFSTFRFGHAILDLDTPRALQFQLGGVRRRMSWREFILALGLYTAKEMDLYYWRFPWHNPILHYPILRLCHRLIACSIDGMSQAPEKEGRAHIYGGQFVARLAEHFGLLTAEILGGLTVISPELPIIDMAELVRLQICVQLDDTWAWVAMGPERQPDAAAGAPAIAKDALAVDEGDQAISAPMPGLRRDVGSLRGLMERSITDQGRFSTWMISCMVQLMEASGQTYQAFDGTFRGSSPGTFHRRTRQRTGEASTSTAQQDPQQPDP